MKKFVSILLTAVLALSVMIVCIGAVDGGAASGSIEVAYGTPVIDGVIDDVWSNATVYKYPKWDFITQAATDVDPGQFRLMWDENYLYVLVEVNDSTVLPDSVFDTLTDWHTRDKIAICIGVSETGYFWFGLRPNNSVPNFDTQPLNVFITEDSSVTKVTNFAKLPEGKEDSAMFKVVRTANGYLAESRINVKASNKAGAADFKYEAGTTFGFDTYIYDNAKDTPSQDHVYPFNDHGTALTSYKSNATKATAVLLAKPAESTTAAATEATTTASDPATTTAAATEASTTASSSSGSPTTGDVSLVWILVAVVAIAGTGIIVYKVRS